MATITDGTKPLHLNGSSSADAGYRTFTWAKLCGTGGYENIMSFQITSAPSFRRGFHYIVNSFAYKWDGSNISNSESWSQQTFYYLNVDTNSTWNYREGVVQWEAGTGIAAYTVSSSGAYHYIQGYGSGGTNVMIGVYIRVFCSEWNRVAINYL